MEKIKNVSIVLKNLFLLLVFVLPLCDIVLWFFLKHYHRHYFGISVLPHGVKIWAHPDLWAKLLGFGGFLIPTLVDMFMCWMLFRLFQQYQKGKIFTPFAVRCLKWVGLGLLIRQFAGVVSQAIVSVALTSNNPVGFHVLHISFSDFNLYGILVAVMVLIISWVMAEGCKLQEEVDLTI